MPRGSRTTSAKRSTKSRLVVVYVSRLWATPSASRKAIMARFMRSSLWPKFKTPAPAKKSMYEVPASSTMRALDADAKTVG